MLRSIAGHFIQLLCGKAYFDGGLIMNIIVWIWLCQKLLAKRKKKKVKLLPENIKVILLGCNRPF